ncbi:MAG: alanine racemase [Planctomycetota bacterium]
MQVNISGETASSSGGGNKGGIAVPAVTHLIESIDTMLHLRPRGLMVMAPYAENPEETRPTFARTAELFADVKAAHVGGEAFNVLSMGMSNDFEVAIEEGSNVVRIGRALFGETES